MANSLLRNVVFFHSAALGDFVVTWPLILAAARMFQQSRVIVVTQAGKGALAEAVLRVESADIESGFSALFSGGELPEKPRKMLEASHAIFDFIVAPRENLARLAPGAKITTLLTKPAADYPRHVTDHLLDQLVDQPPMQAAMRQMLNSIADRGLGWSPGGSEIVIHPGSGSPTKNWPIENFLSLALKLSPSPGNPGEGRGEGDLERPVRFILGEAELDRFPTEILAKLNATPCDSLLDLLAILRRAKMYIGNDSGPTHLAAILGVPTIAIFGPSNPTVWRPLGPRGVNLIHRDSLPQITVDEVYDVAKALLQS